MATLEITLRMKAGEIWPVIAEFDGDEGTLPERSEGLLALDTQQLEQLANEPKLYGDALGQALFQGPLHEAFVEALARSAESPMRLLLFVEDFALRTLRWERLCAPVDQGWVQLASYQRTRFSRYLPSLTDRRFPPIGRGDLRALIVVASPPGLVDYGLAHFDEAAAVQGVITALGEVPYTLLATNVEGANGLPTLNQICERITGESPTLLHIVAHGRAFDNENLLYLSSDDDPKRVDPVSTSRLRDRLASLNSAHGLPHLIFLSTCESASPAVNGTLGSLGQRLVSELGVPAVVAMADLVTVETANALASNFYRLLITSREVDTALVGATAGLAEQGDISVPVLYSRLGSRPLFDETVKRDLTAEEIGRGLTKLDALIAERAPLLKSDFAAAADTLRRTAETAEGALSEEARADQQQARATIDLLCNEATELSFVALATGAAPPRYDGHICPFPGLNAFDASEQRFFFGRDTLIGELLAMIKQQPCLTLLGPSSSGKSSLVLAGLLPSLRAETPELGLAIITPGELPLAALERELYLQAQAEASRMLVVIDQFEELFTVCTSEEERQYFVDRLLRLPQEHPTVILLRPEFMEACAELPALHSLLNRNLKLIEPLSAEALREVIERQAAAVGLRFEAGLTSTILDEVRGQRGRMPLTQHALRELWARRRGRWLRTKAYIDLGGVRQAIATSADTIYNTSSQADKDRLRTIFVRLTRIDRESNPHERNDVRQRSALADLVPFNDDQSAIGSLIEQLAAKSLIVTNQNSDNIASIEFADNALIKAWPRLQTWLSEDRETLLQLADLRQQAQRWQDRGHDPSFLLRDTQIADAAPLMRQKRYPLNGLERAYIDASVVAQEAVQQNEIAQLKALARAEQSKARKQKQLTEKQKQLTLEQQKSAEVARQSAGRFRQLAIGMAGVAAVAVAAMIVAAVLGGVAQSNAQQAQQAAAAADVAKGEAETQQELALAARNQSQTAEAFAVAEQGRADSAAADSLNRALATEAQAALDRGDPNQAIAIALQALERDRRLDGVALTLADAADQAARLRLDGHQNWVFTVAYSPDGRSAVSGDVDGVIIFWDLERGRETLRFSEHTAQVNVVIFSPDGQTAFSASDDGTVRAWGLGGGRIVAQGNSEANTLAISPAGDRLAVGYGSGELILYDPASGQEIRPLNGPSDVAMSSLAYSPDGSLIASGSQNGSMMLWRAESGTPLGPFGEHSDAVNSLAFSPDGRAIVSTSQDATVRLWDAKTGRALPFMVRYNSAALNAVFSPDGRTIVASSFDQSVTLWDSATQQSLRTFEGHTSDVYGLAFSPDGSKLLTGSYDQDVRLWDVAPRRLLRAIPNAAGDDQISSVAFTQDGKLAAVGSNTGRVTIWDMELGEQVRTLSSPGFDDPVIRLLFFTDERISAISGQETQGWNLSDGTPINQVDLELDMNLVGFDLHEEVALVVENDSTVALLALTGDKTLILEGHSDFVTSVALSPDGRQALTGALDRTMRLWDATNGTFIRTFIGHTRAIQDVAFSPAGDQALSVSDDHTMRLWDLASGRELARFTTSGSQLSGVALDASGTRAITGLQQDGTLLVWQVEALDELITSVKASRSIPELSCELRVRYALEPLCPAETPMLDPTPAAQP